MKLGAKFATNIKFNMSYFLKYKEQDYNKKWENETYELQN